MAPLFKPKAEVPREPVIEDVLAKVEKLESMVDEPEEKATAQKLKDLVQGLPVSKVFGRTIARYTTRDVGEAFIGSIIIALPLLVEDGVLDIADHFLAVRVGGFPIFLGLNFLFMLALTAAILYGSGIQKVQVMRPIFGLIPRRYLGIIVISFITATLTMTLWGRVDNWEDPAVALARICVVWTAGAFGAALGDILPGPSQGKDINELFKGGSQPKP